MPRVTAAIDIGTNSVKLLVARVHENGVIEPVDHVVMITRLGEGYAQGRLGRPAMDRTAAVVADFVRMAQGLGVEAPVAVATAAVRQAKNQAEFLAQIQAQAGIPVRVLTGEEEAAMGRAGALAALPRAARPVMIIDIGGGSTECTWVESDGSGRGVSLPLGAVALTEALLPQDPPSAAMQTAALAHAAALFAGLPCGGRVPATLIGMGGTVTTYALLAHPGRHLPDIHGAQITLDQIREARGMLAALSLQERRAVPGLDPARADIIVAGGVILEAALCAARQNACLVSTATLLHELAREAAHIQQTGGRRE